MSNGIEKLDEIMVQKKYRFDKTRLGYTKGESSGAIENRPVKILKPKVAGKKEQVGQRRRMSILTRLLRNTTRDMTSPSQCSCIYVTTVTDQVISDLIVYSILMMRGDK